ncbi:MAG: metal ABC transporter substrate-binding protein, partial [Planctomycetota bacterium]
FLLVLNKADLLFEIGLDMEHAWLPDLLYNCRNDRIQPGRPGFINCSARVKPLEVPGHATREEGEVHPEGNPHYNTDPRNGRLLAITVCEGLCNAYPGHAETFRKNLEPYLATFDRKLEEWKELARPLQGTKVITYHRSWSYFAQAFGLEVAGEVEPMPGIAPTAAHIAKLVQIIQKEKVPLLIKEPYFSERYPNYLAEKTGIKVVTLPNMSGGKPEVEGYFNFIEHNIKALLAALGKPSAAEPRPSEEFFLRRPAVPPVSSDQHSVRKGPSDRRRLGA